MRLTRLVIGWVFSLSVLFTAFGPVEIAFSNTNINIIEHTVNFDSYDFYYDKINDYDLIKLAGHSYLNHPGEPMLPSKVVRIALPDGIKAETVEIKSIKIEPLDGRYSIFPAQTPVEIGADLSDYEFIEPSKSVYESNTAYPESQFRFIRQADLAGQSYVEIEIYPIQYIPAKKAVNFISEMTLSIKGSFGYECGDYLPVNSSPELEEKYLARLENIISNRSDIMMKSAPAGLKATNALPDGGPYDHVIITNFYFESLYEPLTTWHTRRGLRDTVITTGYIYDNYDGANEKEKIRNFIIDAHQNWGTLFFLMGGEISAVPFEYREYKGTAIPSDMYYADYDDDWEYEVFVGRITAENDSEVNKFINKLLTYEQHPPDLGYVIDYTLLGMDLTASSEPPYYVLTRGQYLMDSICANYIPLSHNVTKSYDTDNSNHRDDFIAAMNDGQNILAHNDHSNYNVMCTGSVNHDWCFTSWDSWGLTNYNKYVNIISTGCYANKMDQNDAISEHFIFGTDSAGAVSFTGNTRSGWFYVGDPMSLSSQLIFKWWEGLFDQNLKTLGELLAYCKEVTDIDVLSPFSDWTMNLLGDPAMKIWTTIPKYSFGSHPTEVEALPQQVTIHLQSYGSVPLANAKICLWKGSEIYQSVMTDANGDATFDIYPTTNGTIYVTATRDDMYPYLGEIEVVGNVPPQCLTPNDTLINQCSPEIVNIPVGCIDSDGNLMAGPVLAKGPGAIIGDYWQYTPSGDESFEVTINCSDSVGFTCETSFWVTFIMNVAPVISLTEDTSIVAQYPPAEISLPIEIFDLNDYECTITDGPGIIDNGLWKYTPTDDETCAVTVTAVDECNQASDKTFNLDYEVYLCGDADDNLALNILDVTFNITFLYKSGPASDPEFIGDADGNGTINILDVTYLIAYLYKSGTAPICPQ